MAHKIIYYDSNNYINNKYKYNYNINIIFCDIIS